jgi:hypothetical protein
MTVTAPQGGVNGPNSPVAPQGVPLGATTVNTTNPNAFSVVVTPTNSVSNASITNVKVNGTTVGSVGGIAYGVPAGGTSACTYSTGTTTYATSGNGGSPVIVSQYPFTDPVFQNFNAQQYLNYGTGTGPGGGATIQEGT